QEVLNGFFYATSPCVVFASAITCGSFQSFRRTHMHFPRFKPITVAFFFVALVSMSAAAWAQKPPAGPDLADLAPNASVDVQSLPTAGPRVPAHKEMPFQVRDITELNNMKDLHEQEPDLAPAASAVLTAPTVISPSATTGFIGLRRSESGGWVPPDTQV